MATINVIFNHEGIDGSSCLIAAYADKDKAHEVFDKLEANGSIYAGEVVEVEIDKEFEE